MEQKIGPTTWWYIAALLGGVLIGALGYIALKDTDQGMANRVLIVSIVPTILMIIAVILTFSTAAFMASKLYHQP